MLNNFTTSIICYVAMFAISIISLTEYLSPKNHYKILLIQCNKFTELFKFSAKAAYNSAAYDTRQNAYAQQAYPTQPQYAPYQVSYIIYLKLFN